MNRKKQKHVTMRDSETGKIIGHEHEWLEHDLISAVQIAQKVVKGNLTFDKMKKVHKQHGLPHPKTVQERFGTWNRAMNIAGYQINQEYDNSYLLSEIERFISEFHHVPSTNEFRYKDGYPGIKAYKRIFGSFNNAVIDLGYTPVCFLKSGKYGKPCSAKDGHICRSREEALVDDSMFSMNIEHSIEPLYPRDNKFNPSGYLRADFLANNIYIEYAGLIHMKFYEDKINLKKQLATVLGIKQIIIYPNDLSKLSSIIGCLKA